MSDESRTTRRGWLRSAALVAGVAGVAVSGQRASAAPVIDNNDPGVFNVLAYGAKGDGVTDDTEAIQRTINDAQNYSRGNASKGGLVFLAAGVFKVSKMLLVTQAIKIFGRGQATIDGATHIVPTSLDFDVIKIVGVNWGVVLERFLIKGYDYKGSGGHFLRIQGCQHVIVREVHLVNCWNGALVDSSGDVMFYDLNISGADVPGEGRYGIKCTAASPGNANATRATNCVVSQWGKNVRTMDGFVLANGYNSLSAINCGGLNCNRAFWTTKDGGQTPNFFVVSGGASDHSNTAVQLDDGAFAEFNELMVTSSSVDNIFVGENITGPVAFSNCVVTTSGGNKPPHGAGYRIASTKSANVSIVGGSVHNTAGHGIAISGNASVLVTGVGISAIRSGKNADGVHVSGSGNVLLTGVSITDVKNVAIRALAEFSGALTFSGVAQENATRGLHDEGSSGVIVGNGSFRANRKIDVDVSQNKNPATCIQSHGAIPWPFYPTPDVPASEVAVQNNTGTNCMVYLSKAKIKEVTVDKTDLGAQSAIYLPVNQTITVNYSGTLTWVWQRVT